MDNFPTFQKTFRRLFFFFCFIFQVDNNKRKKENNSFDPQLKKKIFVKKNSQHFGDKYLQR